MLNQQRVEEKTVSVAELEEIFAGTDEARLFEFIKAELPEEYAVIMNQLVSFMNTSDEFISEKAAFDAGFTQGAEVMENFIEANWVFLQTAPDPELISMGEKTEGLLERLKVRDTALCASFARGTPLTQEDKSKVKQYGFNLTDFDIVVVAAISAGKKRPAFRSAATDSDWEELMARVYPAMRSDTFDELLNAEDPLQMSDSALCDMTSAMMSEIMRDTPQRQAMWVASMNENAEPQSP